MKCRHCHAALTHTMIDLGSAPPSNHYIKQDAIDQPEIWLPLRVMVCTHCLLVQTDDFAGRESLFSEDYAYFSSFSTSWLAHAQRYVEYMTARFGLNEESHVVEVAANDGYLLQYFKERGIPCLGIEPTHSTAQAARAKGISMLERFFGLDLATELSHTYPPADLIVANNVLAHVPDINDFVAGFARLLNENGVATFEFPHVLELVNQGQFDTIYHEHYSYLSLLSVEKVFAQNGLSIFDVEQLPTHGGSLRIYAQRAESGLHATSERLTHMRTLEHTTGLQHLDYYSSLDAKAKACKLDLLEFLISAKRNNKRIGAYGAAAKGNTLLNYCGIKSDLLPWVVDRNPAKQGTLLPGSRIPVVDEQYFLQFKPDYILILPWNLSEEIMQQLEWCREWGAKFVTMIPALEIS